MLQNAELTRLTEADWPALHALMRVRKFPNVPANYLQARPQLRGAHLFGLRGTQGLEAGFVFGPAQDGVAFFDVVCSTKAAGKWARKGLLKALFRQAFAAPPIGFGLRCLWVQPHGAVALRAALAAGFTAVTPLKKTVLPVLVITPKLLPTAYNFN
jgi:hypothetical protein